MEKKLVDTYEFEKFEPTSNNIVFDRKQFDPEKDYVHRKILNVLRMRGSSRFFSCGWEKWTGRKSGRRKISSAYEVLPIIHNEAKDKVLIDAGCGNSADSDFFAENGGTGIGLDLFPRTEQTVYPKTSCNPNEFVHKRKSSFQIQDICERWKLDDNYADFILCNAVLDLMTESDRILFYKEVSRVLKPKGILSVNFIRLRNGHGFNLGDEFINMEASGLKPFHRPSTMILATK